MVELSIIMPVYNASKYLHNSITSILHQNYPDFELIIVNDGSTDDSEKICLDYVKKDNRVKYIKKENGGAVSARKTGVKEARGLYVGFVDADDWVDVDYYQKMMKLVLSKEYQSVNIVCSNYLESMPDKEVKAYPQLTSGFYEKEKFLKAKTQMAYKKPYYNFGIYPSLWSKIIKREYLLKWQLKVPENITLGDDAAVFYPIVINECKNLYIMDDNYGYHYRQTADSMVHRYNKHLVNDVLTLMDYLDKCWAGQSETMFFQKDMYYFMLIKWCIGNELNAKAEEAIKHLNEFRDNKIISDLIDTKKCTDAPWFVRMLFELFKRRRMKEMIFLSNILKKIFLR